MRHDLPAGLLPADDDEEELVRVRLDEKTGEIVVSKWRDDVLISEHRERPHEGY